MEIVLLGFIVCVLSVPYGLLTRGTPRYEGGAGKYQINFTVPGRMVPVYAIIRSVSRFLRLKQPPRQAIQDCVPRPGAPKPGSYSSVSSSRAARIGSSEITPSRITVHSSSSSFTMVDARFPGVSPASRIRGRRSPNCSRSSTAVAHGVSGNISAGAGDRSLHQVNERVDDGRFRPAQRHIAGVRSHFQRNEPWRPRPAGSKGRARISRRVCETCKGTSRASETACAMVLTKIGSARVSGRPLTR